VGLLAASSGYADPFTFDRNSDPGTLENHGTWDTTSSNWWNGTSDVPWPNTPTTGNTNEAVVKMNYGEVLTVGDGTTIELNKLTLSGSTGGAGVGSTGTGNLHFSGATPTINVTSSSTVSAKLTGDGIAYTGTGGVTTVFNNTASTVNGFQFTAATSGNPLVLDVRGDSVGGPGAVTSGPLGSGTVTLGGAGTLTTPDTASVTIDNPIVFTATSGNGFSFGKDSGTHSRTFHFGGDVVLTPGSSDIILYSKYNAGGSTTFSGAISGDFASGKRLYFSSGSSAVPNQFVLSGTTANTYTGITSISNSLVQLNKTAGVDAIADNVELGFGSGKGILQLLASNQIADGGGITFKATTSAGATADAETFDLNGFNETIGSLSTSIGTSNPSFKYLVANNGAANTTSTLTVKRTGGDAYFNGSIVDGTNGGKVALTKDGAGTLNLGSVNTYTGPTHVLAGTLALTHSSGVNNLVDGSISNSSLIHIASGATFDVSGLPSAYLIPSGQSLMGDGTVAGSIQVAGMLSPGTAGVGTLTMTGAGLGLAGGAAYDYDLDGTTGLPLSDLMDLTNASSTVTLGGSYTLNVSDLSGGLLDPTGKTFDLIRYLGADPGSVGTWSINLPAGWGGTPVVTLDAANKAIVLSGITAVPEPTTSGLICLGAAGLLLRRTRRWAA
jgi:autotransporter-associated beta strand protein